MHVEPVAGDEPGAPVRYAVVLHALMSQAEIKLWESWADQRRLEVDDVVHAAALSGLKDQLTQAGQDPHIRGRGARTGVASAARPGGRQRGTQTSGGLSRA